jgi:hypothetical protein
MENSKRLPNFIVIGAMKSATSSLHTQLNAQPGVFMSTPKEPNFFSDDGIYKRGLSWYSGLFDNADPEDICGESSTHYTKLPDYPNTIARLKEVIPHPKLIYVMRHPVDRLISHYMHQWSEAVISCDIDDAIDRYPELISYSCYGKQITAYLEEFGKDSVLPVFFDALKTSPQETLEKIGLFVGLRDTSALVWNEQGKPDNASKNRIRRFYGYDLLINSRLMAWMRKTLIPQSVRDRVKKQLRMQQRPVISPVQLARITEIFNNDLKVVSEWLGVELTCENFKRDFNED